MPKLILGNNCIKLPQGTIITFNGWSQSEIDACIKSYQNGFINFEAIFLNANSNDIPESIDINEIMDNTIDYYKSQIGNSITQKMNFYDIEPEHHKPLNFGDYFFIGFLLILALVMLAQCAA